MSTGGQQAVPNVAGLSPAPKGVAWKPRLGNHSTETWGTFLHPDVEVDGYGIDEKFVPPNCYLPATIAPPRITRRGVRSDVGASDASIWAPTHDGWRRT